MNISLTRVSSTLIPIHRNRKEAHLIQPITLYPGDLYRLPPSYQQVRIVRGLAHISRDGKDFILQSGELIRFEGRRDFALVSPLRDESLVIELLR
jgi:hypothetical protein